MYVYFCPNSCNDHLWEWSLFFFFFFKIRINFLEFKKKIAWRLHRVLSQHPQVFLTFWMFGDDPWESLFFKLQSFIFSFLVFVGSVSEPAHTLHVGCPNFSHPLEAAGCLQRLTALEGVRLSSFPFSLFSRLFSFLSFLPPFSTSYSEPSDSSHLSCSHPSTSCLI